MEYQLLFFFTSQDASIRTIGIDLALKLDSEGTALGCTIPQILKLCASSQKLEKMLGYRHLGNLDTDGKTDLALIPKNTIIKESCRGEDRVIKFLALRQIATLKFIQNVDSSLFYQVAKDPAISVRLLACEGIRGLSPSLDLVSAKIALIKDAEYQVNLRATVYSTETPTSTITLIKTQIQRVQTYLSEINYIPIHIHGYDIMLGLLDGLAPMLIGHQTPWTKKMMNLGAMVYQNLQRFKHSPNLIISIRLNRLWWMLKSYTCTKALMSLIIDCEQDSGSVLCVLATISELLPTGTCMYPEIYFWEFPSFVLHPFLVQQHFNIMSSLLAHQNQPETLNYWRRARLLEFVDKCAKSTGDYPNSLTKFGSSEKPRILVDTNNSNKAEIIMKIDDCFTIFCRHYRTKQCCQNFFSAAMPQVLKAGVLGNVQRQLCSETALVISMAAHLSHIPDNEGSLALFGAISASSPLSKWTALMSDSVFSLREQFQLNWEDQSDFEVGRVRGTDFDKGNTIRETGTFKCAATRKMAGELRHFLSSGLEPIQGTWEDLLHKKGFSGSQPSVHNDLKVSATMDSTTLVSVMEKDKTVANWC